MTAERQFAMPLSLYCKTETTADAGETFSLIINFARNTTLVKNPESGIL